MKRVKTLIETVGISPNVQSPANAREPVLALAIRAKQLEVAAYLIAQGAEGGSALQAFFETDLPQAAAMDLLTKMTASKSFAVPPGFWRVFLEANTKDEVLVFAFNKIASTRPFALSADDFQDAVKVFAGSRIRVRTMLAIRDYAVTQKTRFAESTDAATLYVLQDLAGFKKYVRDTGAAKPPRLDLLVRLSDADKKYALLDFLCDAGIVGEADFRDLYFASGCSVYLLNKASEVVRAEITNTPKSYSFFCQRCRLQNGGHSCRYLCDGESFI